MNAIKNWKWNLDAGSEASTEILEKTNFPWILSNLVLKGSKRKQFQIVQKSGRRIGIVEFKKSIHFFSTFLAVRFYFRSDWLTEIGSKGSHRFITKTFHSLIMLCLELYCPETWKMMVVIVLLHWQAWRWQMMWGRRMIYLRWLKTLISNINIYYHYNISFKIFYNQLNDLLCSLRSLFVVRHLWWYSPKIK